MVEPAALRAPLSLEVLMQDRDLSNLGDKGRAARSLGRELGVGDIRRKTLEPAERGEERVSPLPMKL